NRNPFVDHPEFANAIWDSANVTGVGEPAAPLRAALRAVTPTPFRSSATLAYDLPRRDRVVLRIFDVSGRTVRSLVAGGGHEAGPHAIEWAGRDEAGLPAVSGLYFGRLDTSNASDVRRLVRIR